VVVCPIEDPIHSPLAKTAMEGAQLVLVLALVAAAEVVVEVEVEEIIHQAMKYHKEEGEVATAVKVEVAPRALTTLEIKTRS
jgi:hypothetical protein